MATSTSSSTSMISGLASGIDWSSIVTQLKAVDHQRVDLVETKKTKTESKLKEWQSFNTQLLALKTAAGNLKDADDFSVFKASLTTDNSDVSASDLITATTSSTAAIGSYTMIVNNTAAAQKLSSGSFADKTTALGASYAGDLLINGTVVTIAATDTLNTVRDKINNANSGTTPTGVTASITSYGTGDHRLTLSSDSTGADGIDLLNGSATDILYEFGFTDSSRTVKNHITGGDRSDLFSNTNVSIKSLLGLTTAQTSANNEIVINGHAVAAIDLSTDTLSSLQSKFAAAGVTVSIDSETRDDQTYYRLMVSGAANTYTDKNNILETLGIIAGGVSDVYGVTADVANTDGGAVITAATLIKDIDGYTGYAATDYIHLAGTDTNGVTVSDDTFTLSDTTTVGELLTKIESAFGDVTASIDGSGKLVIVDNTAGASSLAVQIAVKDTGGANDNTLNFDADDDLGSASTALRKRQLVAGTDASLTVDGVSVTRSENTIDDLIEGVTLNLLQADDQTTITLDVARDVTSILGKINSFVSSYNTVASYINAQNSYDDTEKTTGGVLFGDGTLASVKADLTTILVGSVWGVSSDYSTLGLSGINVDSDGILTVDSTVLGGYLKTNFNDIKKLFAANGSTDIGTLEYISHSGDTKQNAYMVHIDTPASQSTSAASNNTSLSGAETLTITEGGKTASVSLTASMTMAQIVAAVNSELSTVYTQTLAGGKQLYADSGQAAAITSGTAWKSVYSSTGASAGLVNYDSISFTGTDRNGSTVSGSYTIEDIEDDTVQGLLSAIETAFDNKVTADINSTGRIVLTDKTSGSSSLALSIDTSLAHDLDFGTVLTSNTGGQEGRYALAVTAAADATNHLVLNHNDYGADYGFTIHQQSNLLWTGGDQTVFNGKDVAGTINGEAATGRGQVLTGDSGEANVDGLVVKYTGTESNKDAGTVTLTLGVAALYDRALFNITDDIDGYVGFKLDSLQSSIDAYETQIEEMEARLDRKSDAMTNRFVQMELAMQTIQNQSTWLTGLLTSAEAGWG